MVFYKNYSFEYNAKSVDLFKATVVCSYADDADRFLEGQPFDLDQASFYGVIAESDNTGERLTIDITAESYARELRNNTIQTETTYRQVNAIDIIKDNLLPDGWELQYPSELDTNPRYMSYILRNGTFISHISTILQALGLDFTIYTSKESGNYIKVVKAYFRDDFTDRDVSYIEQWKDFGSFSLQVDYGKVATSITIMGAESEQGTSQITMDAEMGDWTEAPHLYELKDTDVNMPEFGLDATYLWIVPASKTDYLVEQFDAGDMISVNNETMVVKDVYYLPGVTAASYESGLITEAEVAVALLPISDYVSTGRVVLEIDKAATIWLESVSSNITFTDTRNVGAYQVSSPDENAVHAVYDDVFALSAMFFHSDYLVHGGNLPTTIGFFWMGSERVFYRVCDTQGSVYNARYLTRGVPTCAVASCEHCGTRDDLRPSGWSFGCPFGGTDTTLDTYCPIALELKNTLNISLTTCPLCFDVESVCPITKCPNVIADEQFKNLCPKHIDRDDVVWTTKYAHHKNSIVFPDSYYNESTATYDLYAPDSLIARYGYVPTTIQVKGIADLDGLDKVGEGLLRLSALPVSGQFTVLNYAPWTVPSNMFPGDVIEITVASHGRYDVEDECWYPTQWFDVASIDPVNTTSWVQCGSKWYKIKQKFVIQQTKKDQRGMPIVSFGTDISDYQSMMDYIKDIQDTTSQRHKNQEKVIVVASSENGYAAHVKDMATGKLNWARVAK